MSVRVAVYVTPKSNRDEIAGWRGGELSVKVTSAPEGGKANAAVCRLVASALGVAKSRVQVVRGVTSRHKQLEIDGVDVQAVQATWGVPME
jgi:uncharacterized protein (TIGR00251 family)